MILLTQLSDQNQEICLILERPPGLILEQTQETLLNQTLETLLDPTLAVIPGRKVEGLTLERSPDKESLIEVMYLVITQDYLVMTLEHSLVVIE